MMKIFILLASILFVFLAYLASFTPYFAIDVALTQFIQQFQTPWFNLTMRFLTFLGNPLPSVILVSITFLLLLVRGRRWESLVTVISFTGVTTLSLILKILINRPRPPVEVVNVFYPMYSRSFPSGHVLFYIAFFGFLSFLVYQLMKPSVLKTVVLSCFFALISLIAPSRLYLGHHWFSDTLGSYLLGCVWLSLMITLYRWGKNKKNYAAFKRVSRISSHF